MQSNDGYDPAGVRGWGWLARRPWLVLVAVWCLLSLPWLSGIKAIPFDSAQQFFPATAYTAQQLRALEGPWWNPYLFGGYPQFADPQMMTFQPSVILPMLLAPQPSLWWFDVVVLLHILLAGLGCLRVARSYGLRAMPQLLFALTVMYGAVAASRLQHTPMIVSYALAPWLWWAMRRLEREPRGGRALWVGVLAGLCALQLTQVTYLIFWVALFYGAAQVLGRRDGLRIRHGLWLAAAAVLGMAISAPQWLSTLAFLPDTNRTAMSLEAAVAGSVHLASLGTLFAGNFLAHGYGQYWGPGDLSQDYLYLGVLPLLLWLLWGGTVVLRRPRLARVLLAVVVAALVYALGSNTPVHGWLYAIVPGMDLFRRPADALFLLVPAAALLGALGLQARLEGERIRPHWLSIAALLILFCHALVYAVARGQILGALLALSWSGLLAAAALYWLRDRRRMTRRVSAVLLGLLVVDLMAANIGKGFNVSSMRNKAMVVAPRNDPQHVPRLPQAAFNVLMQARHPSPLPERAEIAGLPDLTNAVTLQGVAMSNGYNPILSARYARMLGAGTEPLAAMQQRGFTPWAPDFEAAAFDLLGVRTLLASSPFAGSREQHGVHFLIRPRVYPRVMNPLDVLRHDDDLPPASAFVATDFERTLWLPASPSASPCAETGAGRAQAKVLEYRPNRIEIAYQADAPAWIGVNEVMANGWLARVDGQALPLWRGNGLFRAVCVPAGEHRLQLVFSPVLMIKQSWTRQVAGPGQAP